MKTCSKCGNAIEIDAYVVLGARFVHLRCFTQGLRAEVCELQKQLAEALRVVLGEVHLVGVPE